jgi:hypothetical protein
VSTGSTPGARKDSDLAGPGREPGGAGQQPDGAGQQGGQQHGAAKAVASGAAAHAETSQAAAILSGAGWRVITVDAAMPLATAWRRVAGTGLAARPAKVSDMPGAAV